MVNKAFVEGLNDIYSFVEHGSNRRFGMSRQSLLNPTNGLYFLKHFLEWIWHLSKVRPDIAHYAINSGWALEKSLLFLKTARFFGAKTVGHLHSGSLLKFWRKIPEGRRRRALEGLLRLDGLVVLSNYWQQEIRNLLNFPEKKLFVVNNPIDAQFERPALEFPFERNNLSILSLGVMGREKGVMDLLDAIGQLKQSGKSGFSLQLAGPEREPGILMNVKQHLKEHDLENIVSLLPGVWGEEKLNLFRNASIFVLPSYIENFPLVVLEAAAAGMAIITTPVGATPEFFVHNESALFVKPGNVTQLAEALVRLVESPAERVRLGRAARDVFQKRLSRQKIMESMAAVYAAVLNGHGSGALNS